MADKSKLLNAIRSGMRSAHYSRSTEAVYLKWIKDYIYWLRGQNNGEFVNPADCGKPEVTAFLSHLAEDQDVAANTQKVALHAVLYLYKHLGIELTGIDAVRATKQKMTPVVLTVDEMRQFFAAISNPYELLIARFLYGTGLRSAELTRLRLNCLDFSRNRVRVIDGKGGKGRESIFPPELHDAVRLQIKQVEVYYLRDKSRGIGVRLPNRLAQKYPKAYQDLQWYYLFPASRPAIDERDGVLKRYHIHNATLNKMVARAARRAGLTKRVTPHTLRHCFATHSLMNGVSIDRLADLMGHNDIETTRIYLHLIDDPISPLSSL